jgi:Lar family restriction alleviation protein
VSQITIKPCPFCGNDELDVEDIEMGIFAVVCVVCNTIGPHQDGEQSTDEAVGKWNERK